MPKRPLTELSYRELQALAKVAGIRANQKSVVLVQELRKFRRRQPVKKLSKQNALKTLLKKRKQRPRQYTVFPLLASFPFPSTVRRCVYGGEQITSHMHPCPTNGPGYDSPPLCSLLRCAQHRARSHRTASANIYFFQYIYISLDNI